MRKVTFLAAVVALVLGTAAVGVAAQPRTGTVPDEERHEQMHEWMTGESGEMHGHELQGHEMHGHMSHMSEMMSGHMSEMSGDFGEMHGWMTGELGEIPMMGGGPDGRSDSPSANRAETCSGTGTRS